MLRLAACLEEHFPHSMANAVVQAARERNLQHEEMHSEVEYLVAHGIASKVGTERVIIGSAHFVFEDEGCTVPAEDQILFKNTAGTIQSLVPRHRRSVGCGDLHCRSTARRSTGCAERTAPPKFRKAVMLTGDSERTAAAIAAEVGVDEYHAEVLPEDKARYVREAKAAGSTVIMLGDGINDSPALSAADVGIAIGDGAAIACEIADITLSAHSLYELVQLRALSQELMRRIDANYRFVIGFNGSLIALGAAGILPRPPPHCCTICLRWASACTA